MNHRGVATLQGTKINSKGKEVPHGTRLYSIASTRYGDNFDGKTVSWGWRRAPLWPALVQGLNGSPLQPAFVWPALV